MSEQSVQAPDPSVQNDGAGAQQPAAGSNGKRKRAGMIILICLVLGGFFGLKLWVTSKTHISTDNAFIESHIHAVASRVPGTVARVLVQDNQRVRKGDLLLELDPADFQTQVSNATAGLNMAINETSGDHAQIAAVAARMENSRARLEQARLDLNRGQALYAREVIAKEQLDRLVTAHRVAGSQVLEDQEALRRAKAMVGSAGSTGTEARVAQKQAQLNQARLNLSYTRIVAPSDGYITRKSVEAGNVIQPGQPLMALVSLEGAWVTANYKEKQLSHVRPGQKVEFEVDAYPGTVFRGRVDSIMAGTGAAFSLLPPENASGNYVKVVQRIPVKIRVDESSDPNRQLRVGMSVVPTILTGRSLGDLLRELNPFS